MPRFISQVFDLAQVPGKGMGSSLLKHSDSDFDADDWASVGVPRALLLLRFLPS